MNQSLYERLNIHAGRILPTHASDYKVGDLVIVNSNERAPADIVLLYTTEEAGSVFIRTDQLDGETDWKVRRPANLTQSGIEQVGDVVKYQDLVIHCEHPSR